MSNQIITLDKIPDKKVYFTPDKLSEAFVEGQTRSLDKVVCGNGMSTAFMNIAPPHGKINILLSPSRAFVTDKETTYKEDKTRLNVNRIKFFHGESEKKFKASDVPSMDVAVFVIDSFDILHSEIEKIADKVHYVLIDESHRVDTSTSFRPRLVLIRDRIRLLMPDVALVSGTATPLLLEECDVIVKNGEIPITDITVTNNQSESVRWIKKRVEQGKWCMVATNDFAVIEAIGEDGEITADFSTGKKLMRNLVGRMKVNHFEGHHLKIISSTAFDGFDWEPKGDVMFYMFEDRNYDSSTYDIGSLVQAIHRNRNEKGNIKNTLVVVPRPIDKPRQIVSDAKVKEMEDFLADDSISNEKKVSNINKKGYSKYIQYTPNKGGHGFFIQLNDVRVMIEREMLATDLMFSGQMYKNEDKVAEYLREHGIRFDTKGLGAATTQTMKRKKQPRIATKKRMYMTNREVIKSMGLMEGVEMVIPERDCTIKFALKEAESYEAMKNFDGKWVPHARFTNGLALLQDESKVNKLVDDVVKSKRKYYKDKYKAGYLTFRESVEKSKAIDEAKIKKQVIHVVAGLMGETAASYMRLIAYREYGPITQLDIPSIKMIGESVGCSIVEFDIRACNLRIAYATLGLRLSEDDYAAYKKNKKAIIKKMNKLSVGDSDRAKYRVDKIIESNTKDLIDLGVDDSVADWMSRMFANKQPDAAFQHFSYYEQWIISEGMKLIDNKDHSGLLRRHDSFLAVDYTGDPEVLEEVQFGEIKGGWFSDDDYAKQEGTLTKKRDRLYG